MRKYETVVVFHPNLNKDGLDAEIAKARDLLVAAGAAEMVIKQWGKREIAYLAMKQKYGYYVAFLYQTEAPHGAPAAAAASFRINDQILKFQSHRIAEHTRRFKGNPRRLKAASLEGEEDGLAEAEGDEERVA